MQMVTVVGGNLYQLALQYLNDPTQWNRIAQQNGLIDPMLTGISVLQVPAINPNAGGGVFEPQ